jgi:hypothetical protein
MSATRRSRRSKQKRRWFFVSTAAGLLGVAGVVIGLRLGPPPPSLPLTPERYVEVSLELKKSWVQSMHQQAAARRRLGAEPAALAKALKQEETAHRKREGEIFSQLRTKPEAYRDFIRVHANAQATKQLYRDRPQLRQQLVALDSRARQLDSEGGQP